MTRGDSGDPLPGALVSLVPDDPREMARMSLDGGFRQLPLLEAITDERGQYVFDSVPPGRYVLRASTTGYVTLQYGQRSLFQRARRLQVDPAGSADPAIALPRGAVIAGQAPDERGEPLRGTLVRAVRRQAGGGARLATAGADADRTDNLGMFRIHGLASGSYLIEVSAVTGDGRAIRPPFSIYQVGAYGTYYPCSYSCDIRSKEVRRWGRLLARGVVDPRGLGPLDPQEFV